MNWTLLGNSVGLAAMATAGAVAGGFLVALWAWASGPRWRGFLLGAGVATLMLPPFLVVSCWLDVLGHTGAWRAWVGWDIYSLGGAAWVLALLTWPVTLLLVWGAWARIEPSQVEAEPRLRGTAFVRGLLVPAARGGLATAAVVTVALTMNHFAVPAILQVKVFPAEVWVRYSTQLRAGEALALSWPLLLVPLGLWGWLVRRELSWPRLEGGISAGLFRERLGRGWRAAAAGVGSMLLVVAVGMPLVQLAGTDRTWVELPAALAAGRRALGQSLLTAGGAATAVTLVALGTWARPVGAVVWALFFVPGMLLGIGLIVVCNRPWGAWLLEGPTAVVVALTVRYLAPAWQTVAGARRGWDRDLGDVACLHGVRGWRLWRQVLWPMVGGRVAAAWYVTYLLCLWDVEAMVLLAPPGGETLAMRVFNLLHYGHAAQVDALCLALLLLALAPWGLWRLGLVARGWRGGSRGVVAGGLAAVVVAALAGCAPSSERVRSVASLFFREVRVIGERGTGPGQFNKPRSLTTDAQDNLYVVDMTGRVQKFSPEGEFLLGWQMPETDLGKAKGMACDGAGRVVVVEPHYARVNHFDGSGRLLWQWGTAGTNAGQLAFPRAVAVTRQGELWVSEYAKVERVQRFSRDGRECLGGVGRPGTGPGEFARAEGIAVDGGDRLYVADSCNHRVQVFGADGQFLRSYGRAGSGVGEMSYPYDIRVDEVGRQYVCEFGNSRIQVFDEADRPLEVLGGPGREPGRFSNPWSIALDSTGALYVADAMNHRVQKFIRRPGT